MRTTSLTALVAGFAAAITIAAPTVGTPTGVPQISTAGARTGDGPRWAPVLARLPHGNGLVSAATERRPWRVLANPDISERNGSSSGAAWWYMAYTANTKKHPTQFNAVSWEMDSDGVWRSNDPGTQGDSGNISGWVAVFSQHRPGQPSDLYKIEVGGGSATSFPAKVNTRASEFHPTMTDRWLLFTRYNASNDRHRVMLFNRRTKGLRTLASTSGKGAVFAGQVLSDFATWHSVGPKHSSVFRYRISTKTKVKIPRPARFSRQYNPSVAKDGTVYYHRRAGVGCGRKAQLVKFPPGGPAEVLYRFPAGRDGARTNVDPPGGDPYLYFTVRKCGAPAYRATDVYGVDG
jgi:hypothetical protein